MTNPTITITATAGTPATIEVDKIQFVWQVTSANQSNSLPLTQIVYDTLDDLPEQVDYVRYIGRSESFMPDVLFDCPFHMIEHAPVPGRDVVETNTSVPALLESIKEATLNTAIDSKWLTFPRVFAEDASQVWIRYPSKTLTDIINIANRYYHLPTEKKEDSNALEKTREQILGGGHKLNTYPMWWLATHKNYGIVMEGHAIQVLALWNRMQKVLD